MKFYNKKFRSSNLNTSSIIFGLSTTPLLLLEKGVRVFHIVVDQSLQAYDSKYWHKYKY